MLTFQHRQILGFLKHSETAPTQGNALAIVRLIHHARLGGLLCREYVFSTSILTKLKPLLLI